MAKIPKVVFAHGVLESSARWQPVLQLLGDDFECLAVDLPAHGANADIAFTRQSAIAEIRCAIAELGGRALLVGHSLGGFSVLATAHGYPNEVAGVVGIGCTANPSALSQTVYTAAMRLNIARHRVAGRVAERRGVSRSDAALLDARVAETGPATMAALKGWDVHADAVGYGGPMWFINGEYDQLRVLEKRFWRDCPQARMAIWPGHTHVTTLNETDKMARAVRDAAALCW